MSANMSGLDASMIRALARDLDKAASELSQVIGKLLQDVQNSPWVGADKEAFVDLWQREHSKRLARVVDGMRTAAGQASRHADEQERVSGIL